MARLFQEILYALSGVLDLRVYTLNPCQEFWEDIRSVREKASGHEGEDPYLLQAQALVPSALKLWGRPGREYVRLLNELTDCNFEEAFPEEKETPTLLSTWKQDVMMCRKPAEPPAADTSLRVWSCPSVREELEAIACGIWEAVAAAQEAGHPLRFHEVGVFFPAEQYEIYRPHVASVFGQCHQLPFTLEAAGLVQPGNVADALSKLMDLPLGAFSRMDILGVLNHPAVCGKWPHMEPQQFTAWCEALGIAQGEQAGDWAQTYVQKDLFGWDQGIKRLALGAFMASKAGPLAFGDHAYLAEDLEAQDLGTAGRFGLWLRTLFYEMKQARNQKKPLSVWARIWRQWAEAFLEPADAYDARLLAVCKEALLKLARFDVSQKPIGYAAAVSRAKQVMDEADVPGLPGGTGGVTVGTLMPMRPLPYRVLFLGGMNEGKFPAPKKRDALDLMGAGRRAGDVDGYDRDVYMFLEALISAQEQAVISFVGRDAGTAEPLLPAGVVMDLLDFLQADYGQTAENIKTLFPAEGFEQHPLMIKYSPRAAKLQHAKTVAESLQKHLQEQDTQGVGLSRLLALTQSPFGMQSELWPQVPEAKEAEGPLRLSVSAVKTFLWDPLEGVARRLAGSLSDEDRDDWVSCEDEPLLSSNLDKALLLREVFGEGFGQDDEADFLKVAQDALAAFGHRGKSPAGLLGALEQQTWHKHLGAWYAFAKKQNFIGGPVYLGQAPETMPRQPLEQAVCLSVAGRPVEVAGPCGWLDKTNRQVMVLVTSNHPASRKRHAEAEGFLYGLLLIAGGVFPEGPFRILVNTRTRGSVLAVPSYSQAKAQAYLEKLLEDLVHPLAAPYQFPLETAVSWWGQRNEAGLSFEDVLVETQQEEARQGGSFELLWRTDDYKGPKDPQRLYQERLLPIWGEA